MRHCVQMDIQTYRWMLDSPPSWISSTYGRAKNCQQIPTDISPRLPQMYAAAPLRNTLCHHTIRKTYLYNFDPLKPHFYVVKLGFTGVYIIFLITAQNMDCGYSLEPPQRGGSNEYPQSMF